MTGQGAPVTDLASYRDRHSDRRIELGIDGNAAFALLGDDIQSGEAEFVDVPIPDSVNAQLIAAKSALRNLRARLGLPDRLFYFGKSHPYGADC